MRIEEYIPFGFENRVSRDSLVALTGLSDATIRHLISEAKELRGVIICSSCHYVGYFRPRRNIPSEVEMAKSCLKELNTKAFTILGQQKAFKKFIDEDPYDPQKELFSEL